MLDRDKQDTLLQNFGREERGYKRSGKAYAKMFFGNNYVRMMCAAGAVLIIMPFFFASAGKKAEEEDASKLFAQETGLMANRWGFIREALGRIKSFYGLDGKGGASEIYYLQGRT
jgi:hypothetical protein